MTRTKTHSTGQVAFARCTFWQLHQINLCSSLCVKSTSSLILAWKGCNYPLLMKIAVHQARQQGAKWTCWIWITPDAWLRPLSSLQCMHDRAWTDELPPLAWLLPFFSWEMGLSWQVMNPLPQTTEWVAKACCINQLWSGLQFLSVPSRQPHTFACLCSPLTFTSWRCRQSPPLDKVQLVCYSSVTLWQNQEKPRSLNKQEIKAELSILPCHSSWYEFKDTVIF